MILTAKEAREQALSHIQLNEILYDILKRIDIESRQGRLNCKYDPKDKRLSKAELGYLENLGYTVVIKKPTDYDNNYYISW